LLARTVTFLGAIPTFPVSGNPIVYTICGIPNTYGLGRIL
jgi:hypothetical protein